MADGAAEPTTFAAWIEALDRAARARGLDDPPLSQRTGERFWFAPYQDGLSPVQALDEDAAYNP